MVEHVDRWWTGVRKPLIARNRRSVATQVFALELVVVILLVLGAILAQLLESRRSSDAEAKDKSIAVAETFAHSPGLLAALKSPNPSAILQPITEATRKVAGVDFIVVMNDQGIRYTHPFPSKIGQRFVGTIGPSLRGQIYSESAHGPLGHMQKSCRFGRVQTEFVFERC